MSVLVVGSVALDSIETPFGRAEEVLGGSASYFSYAASLFTAVRLVGVVGDDFPAEHVEAFRRRGIDVTGLVREPGATFRWRGRYQGAMNVAETLEVHLNVFGEFRPVVPPAYRDTEFVFLANASPQTQLEVRRQMTSARLVVADTMNFWIANERQGLLTLLREVDGLVVNDQEARQLTGVENLISAAREILRLGPRLVVVKKGEHGSMLVTAAGLFFLPAYPTTEVKDPTGAGDSFAGGMMGHLARTASVTEAALRKALAYGTVVASLTVEDFGLRRLAESRLEEVEQRVAELEQMTRL
jgi:sugar/nucleoside kinase (ribokinase family)